jgi:hypothetical protein
MASLDLDPRTGPIQVDLDRKLVLQHIYPVFYNRLQLPSRSAHVLA